MNQKGVLVLSLILLSLILVGASFEKGEPSSEVLTTYLKDSFLSGWVNMSFNDSSLENSFTDSVGNSVTLESLLESYENIGFDYSCTTDNCSSTYESSSAQTVKNFELTSGQTTFFGFKFTDKIEKIDSIQFKLNSNAAAACSNQIKLDVFDNGEIEISNDKSSEDICSERNHGCFEEDDGIDPPGGDPEGGGGVPGGINAGVIYDPIEILIFLKALDLK